MGNSGLKQHYDTALKTGVLKLSEHKFKEVPVEVFDLYNVLRNLDLSKNKIGILPSEISKLKVLKQLNFDTNKIATIPEFTNLNKLEMINFSNNYISYLPKSFSNLSNLKHLYLNNNKLKEFPLQLLGLKNLEVVEMSNNKISVIPSGMSNFYAVELNLSQNEICSISDDLHLTPRLRILKLEENCLSLDAINPALLRDSKVHTINLDGNLFEQKQLASLEGYNEYMERYTAIKKKMF